MFFSSAPRRILAYRDPVDMRKSFDGLIGLVQGALAEDWLFCWTEIGATYVGVFQSLLATCRLQGLDAYTYLVDVLQRIQDHPAHQVAMLTPRLWKEHFVANPLRSAVDQSARNAVS